MIPKYRAFWKSEKKMITNISWIRFDKEDLIGKIEGQTILPIGFSEVYPHAIHRSQRQEWDCGF
ncbi:hypothetical protein [Streptococcus pluranimalium]|uniref:hypothetical protein n=1 Tax=Streptococcus pluranimalium TaxID=82348 RepID=UPI003F68F65B